MTMTDADQAKLLRVFLGHLGRMSAGTRELVIMNLKLHDYATAEHIFLKGLVLPASPSVSTKPREWVQLEFDFGKD